METTVGLVAIGSCLALHPNEAPREHFGDALASLEDLDGGRVPELAVALERGSMLVRGETGEVVWRSDARASAFTAISDQDGDGVRDLVAAWIELHVVSGASGAILRRVGIEPMLAPGVWVDSLGDTDGDGFEELLAASADRIEIVSLDADGSRRLLAERPGQSPVRGAVAMHGDVAGAIAVAGRFRIPGSAADSHGPCILEGARGEALRVLRLQPDGLSLGIQHSCDDWEREFDLARTDDLDGDGLADLVVAPLGSCVRTVSARDGALLTAFGSVVTTAPEYRYACAVAVIGDVDLDGVRDVALVTERGSVEVGSGRTGVWTMRIDLGPGARHAVIADAGDIDGDGRSDFAVLVSERASLAVHSGANGEVLRRIQGPWSTERTDR